MKFETEDYRLYFEAIFRSSEAEKSIVDYFDFREPEVKRAEFNKIRNSIFKKMKNKYGDICQLKYVPECTSTAEQVDHIIPLSSNILNKEIKGAKGMNGKKTPTESFGSNQECNFVLACKKCNGSKKHRFLTADQFKDVLARLWHHLHNEQGKIARSRDLIPLLDKPSVSAHPLVN